MTTDYVADLPGCAFAPYVGPAYQDARCKVLVLGESHYSADPNRTPDRELTRRVVQDVLTGKKRHRFFSSVATVLAGKAVPLSDEWHHVSFYNYVQEYAGTGPRQRPRREAWAASAPAFRSVLQALQPHLVVVCGAALWNALKSQVGLTGVPEQDEVDKQVRSREAYGAAGWISIAGAMNHPASFGFRPLEWTPRIERYRARAISHRDQRSGA